MAILGGTLAALLLLALVFLGVMMYKQYRKPEKYVTRKKVSAFLYLNLSYKMGSEVVFEDGLGCPNTAHLCEGEKLLLRHCLQR